MTIGLFERGESAEVGRDLLHKTKYMYVCVCMVHNLLSHRGGSKVAYPSGSISYTMTLSLSSLFTSDLHLNEFHCD